MGGLYWLVVVLFVGFGVVAIFSVGAPFLLIGLTLVLLWPVRSKRSVVWPIIVGEVALVTGYVLVAPLGCTTTATGPEVSSRWTSCDNLLGIEYSGAGVYHPNRVPALAVALASGMVVALGARICLRRSAAWSERRPS